MSFRKSEQNDMTLSDWRADQGLSLEALGEKLGKSKSYLHEIERANSAPVKLALAIEKLTGGQVSAASLNREVAQIRDAA